MYHFKHNDSWLLINSQECHSEYKIGTSIIITEPRHRAAPCFEFAQHKLQMLKSWKLWRSRVKELWQSRETVEQKRMNFTIIQNIRRGEMSLDMVTKCATELKYQFSAISLEYNWRSAWTLSTLPPTVAPTRETNSSNGILNTDLSASHVSARAWSGVANINALAATNTVGRNFKDAFSCKVIKTKCNRNPKNIIREGSFLRHNPTSYFSCTTTLVIADLQFRVHLTARPFSRF